MEDSIQFEFVFSHKKINVLGAFAIHVLENLETCI